MTTKLALLVLGLLGCATTTPRTAVPSTSPSTRYGIDPPAPPDDRGVASPPGCRITFGPSP